MFVRCQHYVSPSYLNMGGVHCLSSSCQFRRNILVFRGPRHPPRRVQGHRSAGMAMDRRRDVRQGSRLLQPETSCCRSGKPIAVAGCRSSTDTCALTIKSVGTGPCPELLFDCMRWRISRHESICCFVESVGFLTQFRRPRMPFISQGVHQF